MSKSTGHIALLLLGAKLPYTEREFVLKIAGIGAVLGAATFILLYDQPVYIAALLAASIALAFYLTVYVVLSTVSSRRMDAIEKALPEFLGIMASNIRSGHTYDRALMLSARKELGPLSEEIDAVSKETLTGTPLDEALLHMVRRVPSVALEKTVSLIVKGLNSGGKLADLLEATSLDIRRFDGIKKEVDSTVLTYKLFSLAAVCIGAPMLYAVTGFLIRVFAETKARIGTANISSAAGNLPVFQGAAISPDATFYFSLGAIGVTVFFGSLMAGVISKGDERTGLVYLPVIALIAYSIFFFGSFVLNVFLGGFFFGSA
jgi:pilus assembly protein TadC